MSLPAEAEGPAFPLLVKLLLSAMTASVFIAGALASGSPGLQQASLAAWGLMAAALLLMLWVTVWVWRSRTRVDAAHITQSWVWHKQVAWADVTQAKMFYVPGLSWVIAPRLVVRSRYGFATLFHAADPQVLAAFARYAAAPQLRQSPKHRHRGPHDRRHPCHTTRRAGPHRAVRALEVRRVGAPPACRSTQWSARS